MITTFDITAPLAPQAPGTINITIDIISNNEPASFEDSFQVWINDIEFTGFGASTALGTWTIDLDVSLMGPQDVKVTATATDLDETVSKNWAFSVTTEALTFSTILQRRAPYTEVLAGYFPSHTKARGEMNSLYRQFMNPLGDQLDNTRLKLHLRNVSLNAEKADYKDPDWLYQYYLSTGEAFTTRIDEGGEEVYELPSVWGIKDWNKLALTGTDTFVDFWRGALPSRYTSEDQGTINTQLTASTSLHDVSIIPAFDVPVPGILYIWTHSLANAIQAGDVLITSSILLKGEGPEGLAQTERVILLRNGTIPTMKAWGRVEEISFLDGLENTTGEIVILNFPMRISNKMDPLFRSPDEEPMQWAYGEDLAGSYLDQQSSGQGYLSDLVKLEDTFQTVARRPLRDVAGTNVTITDFSLDPTSNWLYAVDATKLYVYDRREVLPTGLEELNTATNTPEQSFFMEGYNFIEDTGAGRERVIPIEMDTPRGANTIRRWYWSMVLPSGTRTYLDLEFNTVHTAPQWKYNTLPLIYYGITPRTRELTSTVEGSFILEMNTEFMGGGTETVKKVFINQVDNALAEYKIDHLVTVSGPNRVAALEDGRVVVINKGSSWILTPMYDSFIADFAGSALFFREDFDFIEVKFNES
jgi:hypothetical protein